MQIRLRIATLLAASLVIAGGAVLAIGALTYQNAVYQSPTDLTEQLITEMGVSPELATEYVRRHPETVVATGDPGSADAETGASASATPFPGLDESIDTAFQRVQHEALDDALYRSRVWSAGALLVMAVVAAGAGWLIAGRALTPLRTMTARARAASGADLSGRVGLDGPHDEIRELGDTFDQMLDRLERAFVAQRRFSSQVSHEIRTPLSIISSEADLLLRDADGADKAALEQIREATVRAERIVGALLVLARSGSGDLQPDDLRLDLVTGDVLGDVVNLPPWREVRVDLHLDAAPVRGDRALLERLVSNLLSNAARHNRPDGWVEVRTRPEGEWAVLEIANSVGDDVSPPPPPEPGAPGEPGVPGIPGEPGVPSEPEVPGIPGEPGVPSNGVGLTVVDSVLTAHGGDLSWDRSRDGAVTVTVRLPAAGRE